MPLINEVLGSDDLRFQALWQIMQPFSQGSQSKKRDNHIATASQGYFKNKCRVYIQQCEQSVLTTMTVDSPSVMKGS